MTLLLLVSSWNMAGLYSVYRAIKKKQLIFDEHFTAALCMVVTMTSSFFMGLFLKMVFPGWTLFAVLSGVFISWKFSSLLRSPAKMNGLYNGGMGGMMGTMLGAVVQNPALCKITAESAAEIEMLPLFVACLYAITLLLVRYSLRA